MDEWSCTEGDNQAGKGEAKDFLLVGMAVIKRNDTRAKVRLNTKNVH